MKNAIVIGGAGFVGQNLVNYLLKNDFQISIITRSEIKSFLRKIRILNS